MNNKKILFIAPESFPINGPECIVNIKLIKLLSENGYIIDLISKKHNFSKYPVKENLSDLGININSNKIITVDNKLSFSTILDHFFTYLKFGVVFKGAHWALKALKFSEEMIKSNKYDLILTKSAPSFLVGFYLKKKYDIKWFATWNDPYPGEKYPEPYGKGINAKLPWFSSNILKKMNFADIHIFPSLRLKNHMSKYLKINDNSFEIISHISIKEDNVRHIKNEKLKIVCSGNLKKPRNPENFVLALSKLIKEYRNISVDIIGVYEDSLNDMILENKLSDFVNLLPPISYKQSLEVLEQYDVALIIEADCEEGIFLPTKVGDYMQYEKIIFSISPQKGVLNDLFNEAYVQYFSTNNIDDIYSVLKRMYIDFSSNSMPIAQFNEEYSEKTILKLYNRIIND